MPPSPEKTAPQRPAITLTTDFGTADGYVGALKGRLLALAPGVPVVDISHEIPPQDVVQGAWCLRRAAREFPPGTVHVAVIDPGVGSIRPAVAVETERFLLLGPDNGVLSLAVRDDGLRRIFRLSENPPHWVRSPSFDGLTLFAPVAAALARGEAPGAMGREVKEMVMLPEREPVGKGLEIRGEVLFFDRFGNGVTNVTRGHLEGHTISRVTVAALGDLRPVTHYAALGEQPERAGALWNSDGHLELTLYRDSLKGRTGIEAGETVVIHLAG